MKYTLQFEPVTSIGGFDWQLSRDDVVVAQNGWSESIDAMAGSVELIIDLQLTRDTPQENKP